MKKEEEVAAVVYRCLCPRGTAGQSECVGMIFFIVGKALLRGYGSSSCFFVFIEQCGRRSLRFYFCIHLDFLLVGEDREGGSGRKRERGRGGSVVLVSC